MPPVLGRFEISADWPIKVWKKWIKRWTERRMILKPFFCKRREQAASDFSLIAPRAEAAVEKGTLLPELAAAALDYYGQVLIERSDGHGAKQAFESPRYESMVQAPGPRCPEAPALRLARTKKPQVPPLRCAPVGMTIHILVGDSSAQENIHPEKGTNSRDDNSFARHILPPSKELAVNSVRNLSSRPERSEVEGPAVSVPIRLTRHA
jgi:hypothetical protein